MLLLQVNKNLHSNARRVIKAGLMRLAPGSQTDGEIDL